MLYIRIGNARYNLLDDGVDVETNKLCLSIKKENHSFDSIKDDFINVRDISILSCLVQEDGRETDE